MSRQATGGRQLWDRPALPYLMLAVSPVLTLPISTTLLGSIPDCGVDEPWWELRHFEIALLPALADFLPFLWLVSGTPGVRMAAIAAGLMGSVRYAIPQAATLMYSMSYGGQENPGCTISVYFAVGVLGPIILALWLVSALIVAVILLRARKRPAARPD